jgi:glycosyltransferase involved in cell wall biosynthesis
MEVLVDAFAQVRRKREDIELRIVGQARGDGTVPLDYVEQFREQCRQKGIIGLEFRPHVADVRSELGRADLLVLPSISPESFGRVLIEAMASGIPVVASRVGGIPEVLAPDFEEMLVEPNDSTALASAVMRLLDWRTERPELGLLCRQYVVERFGQARMIDELVATFEDVVSSRQH